MLNSQRALVVIPPVLTPAEPGRQEPVRHS
jgi:hypothetical protein